jgi:hypothetical protein
MTQAESNPCPRGFSFDPCGEGCFMCTAPVAVAVDPALGCPQGDSPMRMIAENVNTCARPEWVDGPRESNPIPDPVLGDCPHLWELSVIGDACWPMWITNKPLDDGSCQPDSVVNPDLPAPQTCMYNVDFDPVAHTPDYLFLVADIDDGSFPEPDQGNCPHTWVINANSCMPPTSSSLNDIYWITWDS